MKKIDIYWLLPFFFVSLFSCQSNKLDFRDLVWKNPGNDNCFSFNISKTTKNETGNLHLQFTGWINNDKFVSDSLDESNEYIDTLFRKIIFSKNILKHLPKESEGYIKLDIEDCLLDAFSNVKHYILFYPGNTDSLNLKKNSLTLVGMNLFKEVTIISQDEAASYFSEKNPDIEWRNFLDSNPLPSSIELTLKKELLMAGKFDSIKNVVTDFFPGIDLSSSFDNKLLHLPHTPKKSIIYRFTVL